MTGRLLFVVTEPWYFASHRLALARAARDAGWTVGLACNPGPEAAALERDEGIAIVPVPFSRGGTNPVTEARTVLALGRAYRRWRPDVVHHVAHKPTLYGSLAARVRPRMGVVNAVAGMGSLFTGSGRKARLLRRLVMACYRLWLDGRRRRLIVQNPDDAAFFTENRLVRRERVVRIPGAGVDTDALRPLPEPEGPPTAALVGRMLRDKGVHEAVAAVRRARAAGTPLTLLLAGGTDPDNPQAIARATLEAWDAEPGITWLGHQADVAAVWARAHMAVLPSHSEGMPKALLEAAACGRPLVAADARGCNALVTPEVNGLLAPVGDDAALAAALARLAGDPALRRTLGDGARATVTAHHTTGHIARQHLAVYDAVGAG